MIFKIKKKVILYNLLNIDSSNNVHGNMNSDKLNIIMKVNHEYYCRISLIITYTTHLLSDKY